MVPSKSTAIVIALFVLKHLDQVAFEGGCGDKDDAGDLDDDASVTGALYLDERAFKTVVAASVDAYLRSLGEVDFLRTEVHDAVVLRVGDLDEIFHLVVGHRHDLLLAFRGRFVNVSQIINALLEAEHTFVCGTYEYKISDDGNMFFLFPAALSGADHVMHRDKGDHAGLIQHSFGFHVSSVSRTHCEPDHRFSTRHTFSALASLQTLGYQSIRIVDL